MPDFTARYTSGAILDQWLDPADGSKPSRLNPIVGYPHLRHRSTGAECEVTATVAGVEGEVDANLGGRLFDAYFIERPAGSPLVGFTSPAGQSSVQRFTPPSSGHYTFVLYRPSGGAVIFHLDVAI